MEQIVAGTPAAIVAAVALAAVTVAAGGRWRTNRAAEHARRTVARGAEHRRRQILNAANGAITSAVPRPEDGIRRVTVEDVQDRAAYDFGLQLSRAEAAAALEQRLQVRLRIGIETDLP